MDKYFFWHLDFLLRTFTIHSTARGGKGYFFNTSLPLPPASQTLRHQPGDYCRELISACSLQTDSNQETLVSECKSLNTKPRPLLRVTCPSNILKSLQRLFFTFLKQTKQSEAKNSCKVIIHGKAVNQKNELGMNVMHRLLFTGEEKFINILKEMFPKKL